jgi:pimeloyl-ACP methyl ester carboxylesterase
VDVFAMRRQIVNLTLVLALVCAAHWRDACLGPCRAREAGGGETAEPSGSAGQGDWLAVPTLGGKQFWADELFFRDWRIQRNAVTGHYRLLDPRNRRHTWGSFEHCRAKLDEIRRDRKLPPMKGRVVIVLHGLIRSRESMDRLCDYLRRKSDLTVINLGYPSTRAGIAEHAQSLARVIDHLDDVEQINFVGHSMGNIVVRHYLGDQRAAAPGRPLDKRFGRMVMLGPPNQGSQIATSLADNEVFAFVNGQPGQELGADWKTIEKKLIAPPFEFGVIAGGRGDDAGFNPLLPGDDDGTIRVATAHLVGEKDFLVVPVLHSFLMNDPRVMESTLRFLEKGRFRPDDDAAKK